MSKSKVYISIMAILMSMVLSCNEKEIVKPSDIDKSKREILGLKVKNEILSSPATYPILSREEFEDTYWLIETLYNQATNSLRVNISDPDDNRWSSSRIWNVYILHNDNDKIAFSIPGGDFFISTGFLRSLHFDSELYYILAFEALVMDNDYLINRLIDNFGTVDLDNIIKGKPSSNGINIGIITDYITSTTFDKEQVRELDEKTAELICLSSSFYRKSILYILSNLDDDDTWSITRPSYDDRSNYIANMIVSHCGAFTTGGNYQELVLNKLP